MVQKEDKKADIVINLDKLRGASPSNNFTQQVAQIAEAARKVVQIQMPAINSGIQNIIAQNTRLAESIHTATKTLSESITKLIDSELFDTIKKTAEIAEKRIRSHFPQNWPIGKMRECASMCAQGVPIIQVPRRKVVTKIVSAKSITGAKLVAVRNDTLIIEDCEQAITESTWLSKDMRLQILESIDCYKDGKYRAAQSTMNVAFDSLLNEIVDIRAWRRTSGNRGKLSAQKVKQLADEFAMDLMELPLSRAPFYTLLMFPVIGNALTEFTIGDRASYTNHYNRHVSAHTVSSKQYKRSNALFAIMTVASICKITQLRGKNWMQISAREYGVSMK